MPSVSQTPAAAARHHEGVALDGFTEASISGEVEHPRGVKENVTMGQRVPAGTSFEYCRYVHIPSDEPSPPRSLMPTPEELELGKGDGIFCGAGRGREGR